MEWAAQSRIGSPAMNPRTIAPTLALSISIGVLSTVGVAATPLAATQIFEFEPFGSKANVEVRGNDVLTFSPSSDLNERDAYFVSRPIDGSGPGRVAIGSDLKLSPSPTHI